MDILFYGIAIILALICFIMLAMIISDWFVCKYKTLKLYGYYTNGVYVWQLIQYDKNQVMLYDTKEGRMIVMGRAEFIRDFKFLMCDTLRFEVVEEQKGE